MRDGYNKRDSGICDFEERDSRNNHIKQTEISRCEMIKRGIQNGSIFFVAKSLKFIEIGGRTFVLHFDSVED